MKRMGLTAALVVLVLVLGSGVAFGVSKAGTIGADTINGGASADKLSGSDGADTISGLGGADELYGDSGNDKLTGGGGNDKLFDGMGTDTLSGGAGDDFLNSMDQTGGDTIDCGDGLDKVIADWNDVISDNCRS